MADLIVPMRRYKPAHCFNCNTDNVLCYDNRGREVAYATRPTTSLNDILENINDRTLSYMQCKNCGHRYLIDYSLGYARAVEPDYIKREFFLYGGAET